MSDDAGWPACLSVVTNDVVCRRSTLPDVSFRFCKRERERKKKARGITSAAGRETRAQTDRRSTRRSTRRGENGGGDAEPFFIFFSPLKIFRERVCRAYVSGVFFFAFFFSSFLLWIVSGPPLFFPLCCARSASGSSCDAWCNEFLTDTLFQHRRSLLPLASYRTVCFVVLPPFHA